MNSASISRFRKVRIRLRLQPRSSHSFLRFATTIANTNIDSYSNYEAPTFQPKIRQKPFSKPKLQQEIDYANLPLDTYPNPLFNMSKDDILSLKEKEYLNLIQILPRVPQEQDQFCLSLIQLIDETILEAPELVSMWLLKKDHYSSESARISDHIMFPAIITTLRHTFSENLVKLSIFEYIVDPTTVKFRSGFFGNISKVLHMREKTNDEKSHMILNYLNKLAVTQVRNPNPLLLKTDLYAKFIHLTPPSKFAELYSYFFQLNIQTEDLSRLEKLKKTLWRSNETDRFVARTGWINPKWHQTLVTEFSDSHKRKILDFLSINDLREFTTYFIKKQDIVNANNYLGLLVSSFESKCASATKTQHKPRLGDTHFLDDIQTILHVILSHVMTFKGPKNCIQVLKYMIRCKLEVKFETLMVIMKNLRMHKHFQEALLLMNNIDLNQIGQEQRLQLVEEILILIKSRYPKSAKILIGYTYSMFGGTETDSNKGYDLLNELHLLGITHGNGNIGSISSPSSIQQATIDHRLAGFEFTPNSLANVYEIILDSLDPAVITSDFIRELYDRYIFMIEKERQIVHETSENGVSHPVLNNLNDRVVDNLIGHLLRVEPRTNPFNIYDSNDRFETAKFIFNDFNSRVKLSRMNRTTSLSDLLIHTSLIVHKDYNFAAKVIKFSRDHHIPFTFNQIYPFITFHYNRKEYKSAELWYNELVKHSVNATVQPAKELFRIARELGWKVNGFTYRKLNVHKNHLARQERERMKTEPVMFIQDENIEDIVTEELITGEEEESADSNFADELASILYKVKA